MAQALFNTADGVNEERPTLDLNSLNVYLERGDYGQALERLTPLADAYPASTSEGSQVRLLMITSWMGQGQEDQAVAMSHILSRTGETNIRQHAKQLVAILEAPRLGRPKNWRIQLPLLEITTTGGPPSVISACRRFRKPKSPPPPTGPTRALGFGFAAVVMATLIGLTLLLSGCVRVDVDLELPGPDRVELIWQVQSPNDQPLPWQQKFEQYLKLRLPNLFIEHPAPGRQRISTGTVSSRNLSLQVKEMVALVKQSTGLELLIPKLTLVERNWILGVQQCLYLEVDLSHLPDIPGFELNVSVDHGQVQRKMHSGERMRLEQLSWRWNPLGLGSLGVLLLLSCSLLLQHVRRGLGFGFPELPL
ncbi:DUF3153 domain-containing protein [Synechococcus sp. M16CYN]|uniref:DUF3153 domain-containing protein n=1 Tax=Synechococcus sp. M16CYN TaxID=3103139 RepID=UPI003243B7B1